MSDQNNSCKNEAQVFYAVSRGLVPGIYDDWSSTKKQVDRFSGATHQRFDTLDEAKQAMKKSGHPKPKLFLTTPRKPAKTNKAAAAVDSIKDTPAKPKQAITSTSRSTNATGCASSNSSVDVLLSDEDDASSQPKCPDCNRLSALVTSLTERLNTLESKLLQPSETSQESLITETITTTIKTQLTGIEERILHKLQAHNPKPAGANQPSYARVARPEPQSSPSQSKPLNLHQRQSINKASPAPNIPFQPVKCIVITDISKDTAMKLNQDDIRSTINQHYGPIMIDKINRYKFSSASPKFIVQLAHESAVEKLIDSWDDSLFGGSGIRKTVKPVPDNRVGMIRGVPLSMNMDQLKNDLDSQLKISSLYRLKTQDNIPLRIVKVEFEADEQLQTAINSGILLPSANMLLRVEMPYVKRPVSLPTGHNG